MGNCSLKGVECCNNIKLVTEAEGIVELKGPKLAKDILNGYPGYGIFRQEDASSPLASHEYLINGQFYYLLPLLHQELPLLTNEAAELKGNTNEAGTSRPALEVLPWQGNVWKVKLVINSQELEQILSEDGNTEALIEKMRIAANSETKKRKSFWGAVPKPF